MFCPKCGKENSNNDRFCIQCGNDLNTNQAQDNSLTNMFSTGTIDQSSSPDMNQNNNGNNNQMMGGNFNQPNNNFNNQPSPPPAFNNMYNQPNNNFNNQPANKSGSIGSIIKIVAGLAAGIVSYFAVSALLNSSGGGLVCSMKESNSTIVMEQKVSFKQQKGNSGNKYVSSKTTFEISKPNDETITDEEYESFKELAGSGNYGANQKIEKRGKKIVISYSNSHFDMETLEDARKTMTSQGYTCK